MPTSVMNPVIRHLRRAVAVRDQARMTDGQLLARFVGDRDEAAFEALVRRHGPMVLGVCRRILRDSHEADDAFQATFLVLVRRAASVVPAEMLPNWLYGVARQTAVRARSAAAKHRLRERQVTEVPEPQAVQTDPHDDLRPLLDSELASLPCKYRVAVVLCDLEGMTHQGAANRLGWPVGTLASRHSRGRKMLKDRLTRRGLAPAGVALSAMLSPSLVSSTVHAGSLYGTGQAVAGEAVSLKVVALTEGVLRAMSFTKIKMVAAVLFMASMVVLGAGLLAHQAAANEPSVQPGPDAPVQGGKKVVAADKPKERRDRLVVRADGKEVQVWADFGAEQLHAVAKRMSYDEGGLLVLEGNVKVQKRRGKEEERIQGEKVVIDRKSRTMNVQGAGGVRVEAPTLGPLPVAVDFGFPVTKGPQRFRGAGEEGRMDRGTIGEKQNPPKLQDKKPADAGIPALRKELDELREKVKKLEKRLSDAGAGEKYLKIAEFYRRTGHPGSADFYSETVSRRHPDTSYGDKAKQRMDELRKQMGL